jgi:two-component system, NarL family, sensor kinase
LQVIQALRSISRELRPPALAPYGLEKAIRSHAETLQQAHPDLKVHLELDTDGQALPEGTRMALFRIYQTAITNVIRHARATQAEVRFNVDPEHVQLEIQDNGCGFQVPDRWIELARQGHMGLVGAAERAEAAGGKLQVESRPGKGSLIRVIVPRANNGVNNTRPSA